MPRSKLLPPINQVSSMKSRFTFRDMDHKSLLLDNTTRTSSTSLPAVKEVEASPTLRAAPRRPMNQPVYHTSRRGTLVRSTNRPEDGIAALSASLSTPCSVSRDTDTDNFKRSRTMYTTNATLVDRKRPKEVRSEKADAHKRHSNRRRKDVPISVTRGGSFSFPPGKIIKRNDNSVEPCPTQLYNQTKLSYSGKINGSIQLDHVVRRSSRPRIEPLRLSSTSMGSPSGGDDSLGSVISSSKMTLEGRLPDTRTDREWPTREISPLLKQYSYCDEQLTVPPNSEIGPGSRLQMLTPLEL